MYFHFHPLLQSYTRPISTKHYLGERDSSLFCIEIYREVGKTDVTYAH